jgi:outer membrane protein OmpA-like peptidoglycan-associated protein
MRAAGWAIAALAAAGCGEIDPATPDASPPAQAAENASGVTGSIAVAPPPVAGSWIDPEPPGAQAIAEQNVGAPWNANKTTRLVMSMTTLKWDTTTGLVGRSTGLAAATTTLDERLSKLNAQTTQTEITIRLPGSVLFDFDSDRIRPDAERTLAEVAEVLKAYAQRPMRIEGHTDSVASDEYNLKLSERRARSVQAWLQSNGGVKAAFATKGLGESRPAAGNDTAAGRQQNRRVEVIIEKGG